MEEEAEEQGGGGGDVDAPSTRDRRCERFCWARPARWTLLLGASLPPSKISGELHHWLLDLNISPTPSMVLCICYCLHIQMFK